MDMGSVINRAEVDGKSRLPALQRKVAMALLESGDPKGAQYVLRRKPIVLPDGTLKANLDFTDIEGDPPKGVGPAGTHNAVAGVDRGQLVAFNHSSRGFLVSYQSTSYKRLTKHLGDYDDDPEAHDAVYDELGSRYREAILGAADYLLAPHRRHVFPRQYVRDLEVLRTTILDGEPSVWNIADVIQDETAFYTTEPGDIWLDAVVFDASIFEEWADGVLGTDGDDWMMV
ncbi:hypothetical protein N9L01_00135 [bacterium]|nr:hypothetical protein [bacterium]